MRIIFILIVILLDPLIALGKEVPKLKSDITISHINRFYKRDKYYELTKKLINKRNKPLRKYYFNSQGQIEYLKYYGKVHNTKLLDKIEKYYYDSSSKLTKIDIWENDYNKISYKYFKKFDYDNMGNNIKKTMYTAKNDSFYNSIRYLYDSNNMYQGIYYSSNYFHEREYDSLNRVVKYRQIFESKKRWEYIYSYIDNTRIRIFHTYYNDRPNRVEKEIIRYTFTNTSKTIEYLTDEGLCLGKKIYIYNTNGLINKIEHYEPKKLYTGYNLRLITEYQIRGNLKNLSQTAIEKINNHLVESEE